MKLLRDGLYRVQTPDFCAGFLVEGGKVTQCAPILRRKIGFWLRLAERGGVGNIHLEPLYSGPRPAASSFQEIIGTRCPGGCAY